MRIAVFLLLTGLLPISKTVYSQQNHLHIKVEKTAISDVLKLIEDQSGFHFLYRSDHFKGFPEITLDIQDATLEEVLNKILLPNNFTYEVDERTVVIRRAPPIPVTKQERPLKTEISGTIRNPMGQPIPGASILVKGTTIGITSNIDGNFKLTIPSDAREIIISFVGMKSQEIAIGNKTIFNLILKEETFGINEVVAVGYGTQKKASIVGAISTVKATELKQSSTPNLSNAIAGRVAGVITIMGSGKPGNDDSQIYIRGQATTNSTSPLVLVDGIERDWQEMDPADIETFSVLKDASATAVYGVRGANGIILITTKRGEKGKPILSISVQNAIQQPIRTPQYLGSYDFATLTNEALRNDGKPEEYTPSDLLHYKLKDSPYTHPDNDYYKDFVKSASMQQIINMSASGGSDYLNFYISANYLHQEGLYRDFANVKYNTNTNYNRYNFRSNLDFKINKTLNISVDLSGRLEIRRQPNFDADLFDKIRRLPPNYENYINPDGTLGGRSDETRLSPYALISNYGNRRRNNNLLEGSFKVDKKLDMIFKGLSFRSMVGFNSSYETRRDIYERPELWEYNRFGQYTLNKTREDISISTGKGPAQRRVSIEGALNYDHTFGDHACTGMVLYQQSQYYYEANVPTGYLGWVSRVTYAYKSRYLLEFNAGYNGSNQFSVAHRYGFFPAGSIGWVASDEHFWKSHIRFINYLKIRGSHGEIGNDKIGNFNYIYTQSYTYAPNADGWRVLWGEPTGVGEQGLIEGKPGNNNVTWERARKSNIGFDARFLNNKLSLTFDLFHEKRVDILAIPYAIPLVFGMNNPQGVTRTDGQGLPPENIGQVTNRGFDMEMGFTNQSGWLSYFFKGNFTLARNVIDKISEEGKRYEWQKLEGKRIGQYFGLTDIGLFQKSDFEQDASGELILTGGFPTLKPGIPVQLFGVVYPGDCRYKDLNNDGVIDNYDIGAIGKSGIPEYIYGITAGGSLKNFDLTILFQGAGGSSRDFVDDAIWEFNQGGKVMKQHLGRYNPSDPSTWTTATYPLLHSVADTNNQQSTTRWLFSGNYLRVKNIEIGYSVSQALLSRLNIDTLRFFANGTNLFTWDRMMNWDPETRSNNGNAYPQLRTWNFGVKVTL